MVEYLRMRKRKIDTFGGAPGARLRVFFPYDQPVRVLSLTGNLRPNKTAAPCECDWEMTDPDSGRSEWIPGWYVATLVR